MSTSLSEGDRICAYCPSCEKEQYGEIESAASLGGVPWCCGECGGYIDMDSVVPSKRPGVDT